MLQRFQAIRNIGCFESFTGNANTNLRSLSLVYAENGRGKTTLSAILGSLRTGDPTPILARRRLGTDHNPHVVILLEDDETAIYENGMWSRTEPSLVVFDDMFVEQNICSGLVVEPTHRQGLHDIVVGRQGVALARTIEDLNAQVASVQQEIRNVEEQFDRAVLQDMSVADFCALPEVPDITTALEEARRRVAGLVNAGAVQRTPSFVSFAPPSVPLEDIEIALAATVEEIDAAALAALRDHFEELGPKGETWTATGVDLSERTQPGCPFCGQDLESSDLLAHYRAYFSDAYGRHRNSIATSRQSFEERFSGDSLVDYQRRLTEQRERHRFWSDYLELPSFNVDETALVEAWTVTRDRLLELLGNKATDPLRAMTIPVEVREAVRSYEDEAARVQAMSRSLRESNPAIQQVKEEVAEGHLSAAREEVVRLERTQARHNDPGAQLATDWLDARARKSDLVTRKEALREQLDMHRNRVFPAYEQAINELLRRFNAGFRIVQLEATNPRGQPSTEYYVEINREPVPLGADESRSSPSFGSVLSAGDRTTLAFAFFLASLREDPELSDRVVVIDDPVSSLDDYRTNTTAAEIRSLAEEVPQLILLSHSKRLLCTVWQHASQESRSAHEIRRRAEESEIVTWDVNQQAATEYDQHHEMIREYVREGGSREEAKRVAGALRLALEGYLRVACVEHFPPGTLLGGFIERARLALERGSPIFSAERLMELRELKDYANRFHHDTNPAWDRALADLNEQELQGYARRILDFTGST